MMKTLQQIEPRTPISAAPFTIAASGSYYLTANVIAAAGNAINVQADDVTLDLNGFLVSAPNAGSGIAASNPQRNLRVVNGTIRNCANSGLSGGAIINGQARGLLVSNCGLGGIVLGENALVQDCSALTNFSSGVSVGDGGLITHCVARGNGVGIGAGQYCQVTDCVSSYSSGDGIAIGFASSVSRCVASKNSGDGIQATDDCSVTENRCVSNGADGASSGIHLAGNYCRVEGNHAVDNNGRNLKLDIGSGSAVVRNTINGGVPSAANNLFGPLLNSATAVATNTNPHANYSF